MKRHSIAPTRASLFRAVAMLATSMALLPAIALADIYKCADGDGLVTFTDSPSRKYKSCSLLYRDPAPAPAGATKGEGTSSPGSGASAPPRSRTEVSPSRANPGPDNFPRVERSEQRDRDLKARQIVERELASEQRSLEDARKRIAALGVPGSDNADPRLREARDTAARHERNIAEIQRQLSLMK